MVRRLFVSGILVSLLSKKIALSLTPSGSSVSCADIEAFMREALATALTHWTGRSSWTLKCDDADLKLANDSFGDDNQREACLVSLMFESRLLYLDIPADLENLATANALGVSPEEISDDLLSFSQMHSRVLVETLIENIDALYSGGNSSTKWISPEATKLYCMKAPDLWICHSIWTIYDASKDKSYRLKVLADRSIFPDVDAGEQETQSPPDLESLQDKLGPCRLPVRIVGGKLNLSIAGCTKLEIGQILGLPEIDFNAVEIKMAESEDVLVRATLGTHFGSKAVRLSSAVDDDFLVRYAADFETS